MACREEQFVFTMLIGEVDAVPGVSGDLQEHKIATRFLSFVGPFIPYESMCVTFEHFESHGRSSTHTYSGEKVRLNGWSIVLGYLRVWSWIAVFVLPFALFWGQRVEGRMFVPSAFALVAAIVVLVVPGVVTRGRKKRLVVLRKVVGLGCDPAFRYQWRREEAAGELMTRVAAAGLPSAVETLVDRVPSLNGGQLELVFAAAWYQSDPRWKGLREACWARLA